MKKNNLPLFKQTVDIQISGFNQSRIINELNQSQIAIKNVRRISNSVMQLNINKSQAKKAFAILQRMCYNYVVINKGGIDVVLKSLIKHIGLLVGIFIFSILAIFSNTFIWRVEISGNQSIDSGYIQSRLKEIGISSGRRKNSIDYQKATQFISEIDGIAQGTFQIIGTTAYIKVLEEKIHIKPDEEATRQDLLSEYDAEITKIIVQRGTANVQIGSKIQKGTVLIKGETYNSNNELLDECKAKGLVYGKVTFKETHIFSPTKQYYQSTGKQIKYTSLSLFNLKIGKKQLPSWQKQIKETKMFLIPIKITHTICNETQLVEEKLDVDEHIKQLKQQAMINNVIKTYNSPASISTTLSTIENNLLMLNIYIQAEILLGEL